MRISRALRDRTDLAVFTRNYPQHLDEACRISGDDPARLIPFRSMVRWTSVAQALEDRATIPIYVALVDAGPLIQYMAQVERVILDPTPGQLETDRLLDLATSTTRDEGLWETTGKPAGTLYAVSHVERVAQPFPMTELVKISDNRPISADYSRGYTLVRARVPFYTMSPNYAMEPPAVASVSTIAYRASARPIRT